MNHILCITGMHRSGTSLLTSWLESAGLNVHDGHLLGADPTNPKGHFEDLDFLKLQAEAVQSQIPKSHGWKAFLTEAPRFEKEHLERAEKLIEERNRKYEHWGWKDPRSVLFLKQWKELIPNLKVILIWRPCEEVVQSLMKRFRLLRQADGNLRKILDLSIPAAVKLWLSYNQIICRYKEEYEVDTLLLPLDNVLRQDKETLQLINDKLGMGLNYKPINQVFDPHLLHSSSLLITQWVVKAFAFFYGTLAVEKRLSILSDHPATTYSSTQLPRGIANPSSTSF